MTSAQENMYFEQVTNPADSSITNTNVFDIATKKFSARAANFLIILNKTDQLLFARLNHSDNQKLPLDAVNGSLVLDRNDLIRFSSLEMINESGSAATGTVHITYAWLYKDIVGVQLGEVL